MGDALGGTMTGLADTGAGVRDFLAGPGSGSQPIPLQVLNSLLGAALFSEAPGLLAKINADKQARIDQDQRGLNDYLQLPQGREALGNGAMDTLQGLFPKATLPEAVPVEAGPFPPGMNMVATGPSDGPTTGAFILPMSPEQRGVAKVRALTDEMGAAFPIGQYQAPSAQFQISDSGDVTVQSQVKPRPLKEMLVPSDEVIPEHLQAQGLRATETRFADHRGVPFVVLETDKVAEAAAIQQARTDVAEASALRRIAASGAEARNTAAYRETLRSERPEKPAKAPAKKPGDFKRKVVDALLKKKLAGKPFTPQESELYDKLIARPSQMEALLGGAPTLPQAGTLPSGATFQRVQ